MIRGMTEKYFPDGITRKEAFAIVLFTVVFAFLTFLLGVFVGFQLAQS